MQKVGRNDPCPCGSGKKYKKCCMDKDQAANVVRIGPQSAVDYIHSIVEDDDKWTNVLYQMIARYLVNEMAERYDMKVVSDAVGLWQAYSSETQPQIKKAGVYAAAVEYTMAQLYEVFETTQASLAARYDVSVGTISQRTQPLIEYALQHAGEFGYRGQDADFEDEQQLAEAVLRDDPDSADAFNLLAANAKNPDEILYYFKKGMQAGERSLGTAFMEENKGHFWLMEETRPYMRAKFGYAEACWFMRKTKEALKHLEELLELNPNDNQGARYMALSSCIELRLFDKARRLLDLYPDEESASFDYNRILVEHGLHGDSPRRTELLQAALKINPHVPGYLLNPQRLPQDIPEHIGDGDENEAILYVQDNYKLWAARPELLKWLKGNVRL